MAMKMQENYIEGIIRVPLTQFVAEESRNHPPNCITVCGFEGVLQNPRHQITGYISYQLQNKLLNDLKLSPKEFKKTIGSAAIPTIADQDIHCLVNGSALEAAQQLHKSGGLAECTVQICYLPPPQSKKFSDGEIFQNVRHFVKQERYHIAQQWVNIVSGPKRRHLTFLFDRPLIMNALDRLLCLPGLWAGLQLGNWAKHLAAHVDELIINYLAHISDSYEKIFRGHEDLKHLLDESTVKQIQNRAPRWSSNDRHYIEEAFRQKIIFTDITSRDVLAKLEQNLLSFETIIPSIQTFHQNMKYITIGIKILEKHIAIQPAATKKGDITRTRPSLIDSLKNDWVGSTTTGHFQVDHEKFIPATEANADTSIAQLLLAALRYFPLLCREAPLQDVDCEWKAPEPSDYSTLIRRTALQLGFDNPKIRKDVGNATMNYPLYEKPFARRRWRSGKLPCHSFALLFDQSFFLQLFGQPFEQSTVVTPLRTQSAILRAFFNLWDYYAISAAPGIDMAETGMDVEESPWAETQWAEILSSRSLEKPTRFKRKRTKPLQNDQRAGEHWEVPPKNTQEMQMVPWVPSVQAAPVPQRQLTIFEEALPTPNKPLMRAINDYDDEDAEPAINNRRKRADIRPTKKFKGNSTASTIPLVPGSIFNFRTNIPLSIPAAFTEPSATTDAPAGIKLHEGTEPPATTDAPAGIKLHEGTEPPATTDAPAGTELHEDTEPDEMVVDRDIIPEQTATVNKQGAQALDSDDEFGGIR